MADVTVYVWKPQFGNTFAALLGGMLSGKEADQKEVGHAALKVGSTYISVYPPDKYKVFSLNETPQKNPFSSPEKEIEKEGKPSYQKTITWLDTEEMLKSWERMAEDDFIITWASCAGICKNLLVKGTNLSEVSKKFFPESYNWFSKYMTDPTKAKENAQEIQNNYPKKNLYQYLAEAYARSSSDKGIKALGIDIRTGFFSSFSNAEIASVPTDIIQMAEILTSPIAMNLVNKL